MGVRHIRRKEPTEVKKPKKPRNTKDHSDLIKITAKWLKRKQKGSAWVPNCSLVLEDMVTLNATGEIPDVMGFDYCTSVLVEVKVGRGDFLKDFKKPFRANPELGMGQLRFYCCPEGLIKENEVPDNWGLLYLDENKKIQIIKKAEKQTSNLECERTMLLSVIRRNK